MSGCGKALLPKDIVTGISLPPGELPAGDPETGDLNGFVAVPLPPGAPIRDIVTPMNLVPGG
jgi:hypothetical protein